jgi:hypothetical protein
LPVLLSPLAPCPFPSIAPIAGVDLAAGCAGFFRHERSDAAMLRLAEGTTCAGVFTRHGTISAPRLSIRGKAGLAETGGAGGRALIVNAGCANSFTGPTGSGGGANGAGRDRSDRQRPHPHRRHLHGLRDAGAGHGDDARRVSTDTALSPAVPRALLARRSWGA